MVDWSEFEKDAPDLARDVGERLTRQPAYLATVDGGGAPRVHPVTPIMGSGHLLVFMEPTSPKGTDIRARGAFALHSGVLDNAGSGGEAFVRGRGLMVGDDTVRGSATSDASYEPADQYVLFELSIDEAGAIDYDAGTPRRRRWKA